MTEFNLAMHLIGLALTIIGTIVYRNTIVFSTRKKYWHTKEYDSFPTYDTMMFNLKCWTTKQFEKRYIK